MPYQELPTIREWIWHETPFRGSPAVPPPDSGRQHRPDEGSPRLQVLDLCHVVDPSRPSTTLPERLTCPFRKLHPSRDSHREAESLHESRWLQSCARSIPNHRRKDGERERFYSRPGNDLTRRFPLIVETLARLRSRSCIIDVEAVAFDDNGIASFDLSVTTALTRAYSSTPSTSSN